MVPLKFLKTKRLLYNKNMENDILPAEEFKAYEGRRYVNPSLVPNETNQFIDNLRQTQQANTQQIAQQTHNLGTDVPSSLGGLSGAGTYFTSRYQTPQTNSAVSNLRATAQATALNEALANEKEAWSKRYNDAYRSYQKRQNDKMNASIKTGKGSNLGYDINPNENSNGDVNENTTTTGPGYITSVEGNLNIYTDENGDKWTLRNLESGDELRLGGLTQFGGNLLQTFPDGTPLTNGAVYDSGGGKVFMYIQNSQYPNGTFFRVGDSPTVSYN